MDTELKKLIEDMKTTQSVIQLKLQTNEARIEELEKQNKDLLEKTQYLDTQAYKNTLPQTWTKQGGKVISSLEKK